MAKHTYTVRVVRNGNVVRELYGIWANTGDGAIDRAVDMFKVSKSECQAHGEA